MTIVFVVAAFMVGAMIGMVLMAVMAAAGEAENLMATIAAAGEADRRIEEMSLGWSRPAHARPAHPAAAAGAEKAAAQLSERLIRDFTVVRDEKGREILVPVEEDA